MNQRSSSSARVVAVAALVCGFVILIVVIAISLGGGEDSGSSGRSRGVQMTKSGEGDGKVPKAYIVQNGDTLTSIAQKTGVPVSRIEELNPGVDPQILVSGEKLKLR